MRAIGDTMVLSPPLTITTDEMDSFSPSPAAASI